MKDFKGNLSTIYCYVLLTIVFAITFIVMIGLVQLIFTGTANMETVASLISSFSNFIVSICSILLVCYAVKTYKKWKVDKTINEYKQLISLTFCIYHTARQIYNSLNIYQGNSDKIIHEYEKCSRDELKGFMVREFNEIQKSYCKLSEIIDVLGAIHSIEQEEELIRLRVYAANIMLKIQKDISKPEKTMKEFKETDKNKVFIDEILKIKIFNINSKEDFSLSDFKNSIDLNVRHLLK
ncbi:hypothetical protein CWC16_00550 [Pseudoalteromonas sp. S3776]|uniref:hypothetical protein n=1 Tax=unclassified Pseudoalteromonas TaxID=194690 RepID=UPI00110999B0|nr:MULTISPECIES: hypothetical protein [unclassified Pseudoalteromonas]TMO75018.1 hypothetical protein CWC17_06840 [Pseudoalteromonas sp. S3785]TMO82288.1 hypothetical protein CWC16_00550 [Pseudoalteromonas sp. S3776]